ncbi:ImmA/IrrE family metallo-endopeptidase [Nonomuraea sp. MG754425]|uniref:ImmA/IrrE family metallo-endopeptidase n=1 Tax=Nonomuraea sp. MG754425 TaxID=2570319 RepID=UPI001F1758EF|nr:ImmA/IrrE family metallo-endopeptidase [Nonomuraea sp. MG754425]MCF6473097.1 ImmA/IrrE family metallo-endopeptidase [Nonomuraea sp. MG754425]
MSASERIPVTPSVLSWARRSGGLSELIAAQKLGISVTTLHKWETGAQKPTLKQLRKAAGCYKRPLAVLLLSQPPPEMGFDALRDFRRLATSEDSEPSSSMQIELRRAHSQREVFLELAEIAPNTVVEPQQVPSISAAGNPETAGSTLRDFIGLGDAGYSKWSTPHEALNAHIEAIERKGIMVIHTKDIALEEMRGFCIADFPYPVIALNGTDWPRPRLFTLIHELCHIALRSSGMCDLHDVLPRARHVTGEDRVEKFCNHVAASTLMPSYPVLHHPNVRSKPVGHRWSLDELGQISRTFHTSSEALLLRLITLEHATWQQYRELKPLLDREYQDARRRKKAQQQTKDGGPSFYVVKARNLGRNYVLSVVDAFQARSISSLDAACYLDVKYDQIPKLAEEAFR